MTTQEETEALALLARLQEMRTELHVNELRHSGTKDGAIYSRWGTTVALAIIALTADPEK